MNSPGNADDTAKALVRHAETQLNTLDPAPFSPPAFTRLKAKVGEYIAELISESMKVSRRHQADTISAAHVERASEYLVTSMSRRIYRHLGTLGGILFGAALSNVLAMSLTGQYTGGATIVSVVLGIVGAFLIALHIAKD